MVTPKEFRLGAVSELIGMALFFFYYKLNLPFLSISAANMVGEAKTTYTGFQELCLDSVRGNEWIGWVFSLLFILIILSTVLKGFVSKKSAVVYLHSYSISAMVFFAFFFTIAPFLMAAVESYVIGQSSAEPYLQNVSVVPCILVFPFGIYFAVTTFFSYKRLVRCYDECPKQVARYAWPFFTKSWLERHYGKKMESGIGTNGQYSPQEQAAIDKAVESEPSAAAIPNVSPSATNASNDMSQPVTPPVQKTVEVPASPGSRKKYYIIGGASVLVVLSVLFFFLKGGETVEAVNVPAIKEILYEGRVGKSEVQMCLKQEGDSLYGTYFYKRNKQEIQLSGKIEDGLHYVVNEFVNGKNTGTFKMDYGEYDGEHFFTGKWTNGKKQVNVYLDEMESRILPSTDVEHPLVGEWQTGEDAKAFAHAQLGLYNRDIKGAYGIIKIMANDCLYTLYVDSIMKSEGCDAFVHTYEQNLTLHYLPSDKSLRIETEKWGTYNLYMDFRDLEKRLADRKALQQSLSEASESLSEAESSPEASEQSDIVENEIPEVPYIAPVEETDEREEAERARLQAELAAELHKEAEAEDPNKIYDKVEVMPEYPGGAAAFMRYLAQNVKYPTVAQENGTQGIVVVQFVVDADGSVTDAHVTTSVDPYLDEEALRVIKSMPRWTPGKLNGKPVRVKYTTPIKFRLS